MNKKGFTLLEATLFLAISGALALIAFIGLGPRLRNVRFTNSVRSVEASVSNEFGLTTSGGNTRPETGFGCEVGNSALYGLYPLINNTSTVTGSATECVINGKIAVFNTDNITYYSIISLRKPINSTTCNTRGFAETLTCYRSRISRGITTDFPRESPEKSQINYESGSIMSYRLPANTLPLAFGYVQDPSGTQKYQFFHTQGNDIETNEVSRQLSSSNTISSAGAEQYMCMRLDSREARITFNSNTLKPNIEFEGC